jgi:hypothetical protein
VPDNDFEKRLPHSQPEPHRIDVDAVIRRARRRRVPSRVGIALVSTLAVVGVFGGGIYGLAHLPVASSGSASSADLSAPKDRGAEAAPTGTLPATCGRPAPVLLPSPSGLVSTVKLASESGKPLHAFVTLTNTGQHTVHGGRASAVVVFARNETVANVSTISQEDAVAGTGPIDLSPGESKRFALTFSPGDCAGNPLAPGAYRLYGEIRLIVDGKDETITGPATPVNLH